MAQRSSRAIPKLALISLLAAAPSACTAGGKTDDATSAKSDRLPLLAGQRLPAVAGVPLREGTLIQASSTELVFDGERLAGFDDGLVAPAHVDAHLIGSLHERLSKEAEAQRTRLEHDSDEWRGRVLLALDGRLRFGALVDLLYTTGRAGFLEADLLVAPKAGDEQAIPLQTARDYPAVHQPRLHVFISDQGYRVRRPGDHQPLEVAKLDDHGQDPEAWDQVRLATLAGDLFALQPLTHIALSADRDVRLEVFAATLVVLLGVDCRQHELRDCPPPEVFIEAAG